MTENVWTYYPENGMSILAESDASLDRRKVSLLNWFDGCKREVPEAGFRP